ncbi:MAG: single-stranded-DNA-specific exonuclease RecJ, partial [Calditrichia bacterium]
MEYKWVIDHPHDEEVVDNLSKELGIPDLLSRVLLNRGIDCFEDARNFFRPDLEKLHDPFLMKDMDVAVERLSRALREGEKILVFGDYDVDGVSSCALLYLVLSRLVGPKVCYYIPDRISEGYGLSRTGIDHAVEQGVSLILTVDCGVTAVEEIHYARQKGIDVIVTDHHEPGEEFPEAVAILDPKRPDCAYPFNELAGVGVGYKFMQGLFRHLDLSESDLDQYLDIVAIGSCADIVPLIDENRILVRHGLDHINYDPRYGIKALLESTGLDRKEISVGLIVFVIAPRINAVGRMGDARRAVQLLTAESLQKARTLAMELEKENQIRRNVDEATLKEALEIVENRLDPVNDYSFVVYKEDWHPGVIGIIASRILERYYRPTIMISVVDGIGKGSARSISNFNIYEAIKECGDLLMAFGGHKYAAGLTIAEEKIPPFVEKFNAIAKRDIKPEDLIPRMTIDCEAELSNFDKRFMRLLKLIGPFGPMNMRPVFISKNVRIVGEPAIVGNNHLKMQLEQNGVKLNAIGFNLGDTKGDIVKNRECLDCA